MEAVLAESEAAREEAAFVLRGAAALREGDGLGGAAAAAAAQEVTELRARLAEVAELMPALEHLRQERDELEAHNEELFAQLASSSDCLQREAGVSRAARREQSESEARWKEERGLLLETAARLRSQLRSALLANEGALLQDQPD